MASIQDLDLTILTKSLKLLHSPDEDSAEQLRILVEETIKSKYGNRKSINLSGLGLLNKKSSVADKMAKGKRIKLDESTKSSPVYGGTVEETSDSDSGDGVALEILDDDLSCVICREMAVGAGNNLVECLECHSLYHQECHDPPVTQNVNDPRFVWYCSDCTKNLNKAGSSKGSPSNLSQSSKSGKTGSKNSAPSNNTFNVFSSSSKSSSSSLSSSNSKPSSSSHLSSKTTTIPIPKMNIIADKRLQIMKKNAAKKQEKRRMTK